MSITRATFEELVADLYLRATSPLLQALAAANKTNEEMSTLMLVGGCTRIPKIQEMISVVFDGRELGKGINADEAATMGAAYQVLNPTFYSIMSIISK